MNKIFNRAWPMFISPFTSRLLAILGILVLCSLCGPVPGQAATRDVTAYGATGNGSSNDTNAIQSAVNACSPGDTVYFPAGTYVISGTIHPGPGCNLLGVQSQSTLRATNTSTIVEFTGGNTDASVMNLIFDLNNVSQNALVFDQKMTGVVVRYNKFVRNGGSTVDGTGILLLTGSAASAARDGSIDHNIFDHLFKPLRSQGAAMDHLHADYNYMDSFYQGFEQTTGAGTGVNNTFNNNTFIRGQRCGIEFWDAPMRNSTIQNNWFGEWRQCTPGQFECGGNPNGFGNWFIFAQLISLATGGDGWNLSGNFLKCGDGMSNGVEWSATAPSTFSNNLIKVCTVTAYVTTGAYDGFSNNIACSQYDSYRKGISNGGFWAGVSPGPNPFYGDCSNPNVPADPPVPPLPFGPGSNQAIPPTIMPNAGTFSGSVSVTLNAGGTPGAAIHYTTNGANPTSASPLYSGPFTLNASATVKAISTASGFIDSAVVSANFTVTAPPNPVTINLASPSSLSAQPGQMITYTLHYAGGPTAASEMIFTHFMAASGDNAFTEPDHYPNPLTTQWTAGGTFSDVRTVTVPANLPVGTYKIMAGLYNFNSPTFDRLALTPGPGVIADPGTDSVHELRYQIATLTVGSVVDTVPPVLAGGFPKANPSPVTDQTTQLSVQATDDMDGPGVLIYHWTQTAGPAIPRFPPPDSNAAASITVMFPSTGSYTFQAIAKDTSGNPSQPGSVTVTVNPAATIVGVSPANPSVMIGGSLDFTAAIMDQFGHAILPSPAVTWSAPPSAGTITSAGHFTAGTTAGTYLVTATEPVSGKLGLTNVTVSLSNPPTVNLTSPVNNQSYMAPATIAWQVDWSAGTNAISKVDLLINGNPVKTYTNPSASPLSFVQDNVPPGNYQLHAVVTDTMGLSNGSSVVLVTVTSLANKPPVVGGITAAPGDVDLGTPGMQQFQGMAVQYLASISDADSDALTYQWYYTRNGGSRVTYSQGTLANGSGAAQVSFTYPSGTAGTAYNWILSVTDNKSAPVEQSLPVTVIARPGQGSLPQTLALTIPDISLPVNAVVGVSYNPGPAFTNLRYIWTVTPVASESATSGIPSPAPGAIMAPVNSNTLTPVLSLAQWGLVPGRYALTVYATDGNTNSNTAAKTVTLVSADISQMKVYPNPWRKDRHATKSITFANLPSGSTVKVFTLPGRQVVELKESGGSVRWNLKNDSGDAAASGVYLYLVTDAQGNKAKGKIAVIK